MGKLNSEDTWALLREPIISFITTLRADGTPHVTPVWHMVDGDEIVVAVDSRTVKARNVLANPNVALCVAVDASPQPWVLVEGAATLTEEGALEFVHAVAAHYLGADKAGPYLEETLPMRDFRLIRIAPRRVTGWDGVE